MTAADSECVLQRAREQYPDAHPRIISDNGPQFIARDFKEFIRLSGMTHVRTSPYYPQSNGKLERWHQTLKVSTIRRAPPRSLAEGLSLVARFRVLQSAALAQRDRLHHAGGASREHPGAARSQAGNRTRTPARAVAHHLNRAPRALRVVHISIVKLSHFR
jgi:hypothetical protein